MSERNELGVYCAGCGEWLPDSHCSASYRGYIYHIGCIPSKPKRPPAAPAPQTREE